MHYTLFQYRLYQQQTCRSGRFALLSYIRDFPYPEREQSTRDTMRKPPSGPNRLRMLRRRLGLTQRELADLIGHSTDTQISRLERGLRAPHFVEALKLELVFSLPATEIFTRLTRSVLDEVVQAVEKLNEKLLQSGCLRVTNKAGQLTDVLVSLRNRDSSATESRSWSVTRVDTEAER